MTHTRVYHDGRVLHDDLPVDEAARLIGRRRTSVWIDLTPDDEPALRALAAQLDLHAVAVRDALTAHPAHTFARYASHDFLSGPTARFDPEPARLRVEVVSAFLTPNALITVRRPGILTAEALRAQWDQEPELAGHGVGFLLYGLLEVMSRTTEDAVRALDEALDELAEQIFDYASSDEAQRRSLSLRRCLVSLRRAILPFDEALDGLGGEARPRYDAAMEPYLHGVHQRVRRMSDWTESLREMVASIAQTTMSLHDSRMTVISKKVSGWAALVAVPAVVTGFFGINVPYPGIGREWGFVLCCVVLVASFLGLYATFKRRDWL
ncbi:magnesium transporter CorA [Actinocatenispora thailandica]|uniref:Magnesium transporter CorA n=1 Tax=Actinocatenispora thailandica TaxID=227318 RepID=A0A7R7DTF9_9ACTN|nr:magnesium transporter CorA family protein [Actinocatenispora thailandica]BCJ37498.1 magnesium transporter CorA [Actinocatenispora thailandica]